MKRVKLLAVICTLCMMASVFAGCGGDPGAGANGDATDTIKIGVILPFSGPVAPIGEDTRKGLDLAIDEINEAGGVSSMGGAKFELIYADSKGDPKTGMSEAERLILKEDVAVLMGAYQSSVTFTISEVAEKYKRPFLSLVAVADSITERGFKYTFRINARASDNTKMPIEQIKHFNETMDTVAETVAIIYEDSEWGQTNAEQWREAIADSDLKIVLDESYPATTTDLMPLVTKIKNAKPDILFSAMLIADGILLTQTMDQMNVNLIGWFGGGSGELDTAFLPSVGAIAEGICTPIGISEDMLETDPSFKELNDAYLAKYGGTATISNGAAIAYCNGYALLDVFERAASIDSETIREAFVDTDIQGGKATSGMVMKRIVFGEDGHNKESFSIMVQLFDNKWKIVYPSELVNPDYTVKWPIGEIGGV